MKSIEMDSGGPVIPLSKSRAICRSAASTGSSRWPIPGTATHAPVISSYSRAAARSPRLAESAVCRGPSTCMRIKITATTSSGTATPEPRSTAATSTPVATAKPAGSSPRAVSSPHQPTAIGRSARHSAAASRSSCRSPSRASLDLVRGPSPVTGPSSQVPARHA